MSGVLPADDQVCISQLTAHLPLGMETIRELSPLDYIKRYVGALDRTLSDHRYDSPAVNGPIYWRVILAGAEHCSGKKYRRVILTGIPPGIQSVSGQTIRISFNSLLSCGPKVGRSLRNTHTPVSGVGSNLNDERQVVSKGGR
jgi:hypothetical protein